MNVKLHNANQEDGYRGRRGTADGGVAPLRSPQATRRGEKTPIHKLDGNFCGGQSSRMNARVNKKSQGEQRPQSLEAASRKNKTQASTKRGEAQFLLFGFSNLNI